MLVDGDFFSEGLLRRPESDDVRKVDGISVPRKNLEFSRAASTWNLRRDSTQLITNEVIIQYNCVIQKAVALSREIASCFTESNRFQLEVFGRQQQCL
jgi:hypothetical protein